MEDATEDHSERLVLMGDHSSFRAMESESETLLFC